jgi:3(or 17)beta-hydroxysteroid dehydrogenase
VYNHRILVLGNSKFRENSGRYSLSRGSRKRAIWCSTTLLGIGWATALMMVREGAKIVVADLQGEQAQSVANELKAAGAESLGIAVDVASETSVKQMTTATLERFDRIDILANIAGIRQGGPGVKSSNDNWRVPELNCQL